MKGRLSTDVLLINVPCFARKVNDVFNINSSLCKLFITRRSIVLSFSRQKGFLVSSLIFEIGQPSEQGILKGEVSLYS